MDTKRIVGRSKHLDLCAVDPDKVALPQVDSDLRNYSIAGLRAILLIHVEIQKLILDQIVDMKLFKLT